MAKFKFSDNNDKNLERIEDYILKAPNSVDAVSDFLDQHDKILQLIE